MQCIKHLNGNDFEQSLRDYLKITLSNKTKITKIFGQKKLSVLLAHIIKGYETQC
jgi:hypothetical protein